ncbi:DUF4156 domain-containing protein [Thiohalobacter thiocyanaticus]|uniref:DUF4156 domain-containing protein n=1 Tax=Thiohalobacter thiocyanaticus TaxID=585455 RepID=A0A426QLZ2_9GAMM|nr:DUF4156 domain-containing protein [Thiohalobacter thiocyanaticus]RRQ22769.1 DUF4156 domain-containing protein [Thiohalobacter thiocyanaticus]
MLDKLWCAGHWTGGGLAAGAVLLMTGCTWVEPTDEGAQVEVVQTDAVADCHRVGTTRVSVLDRLAGVPRSYRKLEQELDTLARNSAARMDGDRVVAETEIVDGERTYAVYDCSRPRQEEAGSDGAEVFPLR